MKGIKGEIIKEDILSTIKEEISNGKIFIIDSSNTSELKITINYILSKGYNLVTLNELLDETNNCN